jgi:glycosyltransferase involved in cell wall biosynthesis
LPEYTEAAVNVVHFQRRPLPGVSYSLETYFDTVRRHLPADVRVDVCTARDLSVGILPRLRNAMQAFRHRGEINHVTGDIQYAALALPPSRTILTILDLVYLDNPSSVRRALVDALWYQLPVRRVAIVTTISEFVRRQLLERVAVPAAKVRVVPVCISPSFVPRAREFDSDRPTILHVGTTPNKNLDRLVAALDGLSCRLHVVGVLDQRQRDMLERSKLEFRNSAHLSQAELVRAYEECDLLAFCSTYEGFGMPIVEAQRVGRPVVTSDVASMPEVAGGAACLIDPRSVASIRDGIRRVITDAAYRDELRDRGAANTERFAPERVAAQFHGLYAEIAAGAAGSATR